MADRCCLIVSPVQTAECETISSLMPDNPPLPSNTTDTGTSSNTQDSRLGSEASASPTPSPAWLRLLELANPSDDQIKELVHEQLKADLGLEEVSTRMNILFFYDSAAVARSDTDLIYRAASNLDRSQPVLLILDSTGGDVAAAYFIAKICREYSSNFQVAVPRRAKSAATLICCGAESVHMGNLSELGPIDPQFDRVPALALKNSVEHLAELTKRHPHASEMFASYLAKTLRIEALGYYERVAESAAQYAERLLRARRGPVATSDAVSAIAQRLVYMYKDHGFVIDAGEAGEIFGSSVVRINTAEYHFANRVYERLSLLDRIIRNVHSRYFAFAGGANSGCQLRRQTAT